MVRQEAEAMADLEDLEDLEAATVRDTLFLASHLLLESLRMDSKISFGCIGNMNF